MSKKGKMEGVCKLTLKSGRFVDSHLIPKALTRAEGLADGLIQHGKGRTEKRFSSWYDKALVIEAGEKILSEYDDRAIRIMRNHQMIWSGWGPAKALTGVYSIPGTPAGVRRILFDDQKSPRDLRLFFLSLLWRAAATNRPEFEEVDVPAAHLEQLRIMVLEGNPEPYTFFPVCLIQLSTMGQRHNYAPLATEKTIPTVRDDTGYQEPIFRFYFDGLIVHFSRFSIEENEKRDLSELQVGEKAKLSVTTMTYEGSFQAINLALIQAEAELGRPLTKAEADRISQMV